MSLFHYPYISCLDESMDCRKYGFFIALPSNKSTSLLNNPSSDSFKSK